jgi:hypothetical protein
MKRTIMLLLTLLAVRALMADEVKALLGIHSSRYFFSSEVTSLERRQKTGLGFGLGYAREVAPRLMLEARAILREKGAKAAIAYAPGKEALGTYRCSVLSVPLLASYRLRDGASPYFAFGPEFDFVLSHKLRLSGNEESADISDNTNKFMFGVGAALGYALPLERWGAFVELRYDRWLTDLWKSPAAKVGGETISLLAGVAYHF